MARPCSLTLLALGLIACGPDPAPKAKPLDLRADSNRDGQIRFDDDSDSNKKDWNKTTGAIFLANIDDDSKRCKTSSSDLTLALCNDAADDVVNGEDDALDLARMKTRPWPQVPGDAVGRIVVDPGDAYDFVRLFKRNGTGPTDFEPVTDATALSREDLQAGLELAIEAKDIVRDTDKWGGYVNVTVRVTSASRGVDVDTVRMRVAPVLTYHHLLPAETIWVPSPPGDAYREALDEVASSCAGAGVPAPQTLAVNDQWAQDYFEPAFMSMPGPSGTQHVMRLNYRSANVWQPTKDDTPLRPAGQVVFALRGRDVAAVQQFDREHATAMDGLNSFGNLETIPPYEKDGVSFPLGRILRGSTQSFFPDPSFSKMVDAQGLQPPIDVDTSWLKVGHVDETLSFVRSPSRRGWVLLANDPRLAKKMLEDESDAGHGNVPMFVGKSWINFDTGDTSDAEVTIDQTLADTQVMQASAEAAAEVDGQLTVLKNEIGLSDDEIIKVPFLHTIYDNRSIAYQPGTVNGLYASDDHFIAPDPHGPVIAGRDPFKTALSDPLGKLGVKVDWVENWDGYHRLLGEVHCGTNATRKIPDVRWWETGR